MNPLIDRIKGDVAELEAELARQSLEVSALNKVTETQTEQVHKLEEQRDSLIGQLLERAPEHPAASSPHYDPEGKDLRQMRKGHLDLIERVLIGTLTSDPPLPVFGQTAFEADKRQRGLDWPSSAFSMIGAARMHNLRLLMERVIADGIPGDFVETGVWRGGASMMAKAVIEAYGETTRSVYLADSFAGLPEPNPQKYPMDEGLNLNLYSDLAVSEEEVRGNFEKMNLLDERVITVKGWFRDTMPNFPAKRIALLRLDGDLYESTIDPLNFLYDRVSTNGWIIVDDYECFAACQQAVVDFMNGRGLNPIIQHIDGVGVFFQKV